MDVAITIVMLVPVLLAVALIIGIVRRNVTERQAGDPVNITGAIPAVIVLMVAVLIIGAMGNAASPYVYDEESGELTIQQNVPQLSVQPWDSYASEVRSLVIEDGLTVGAGAFDTLTSLEYVSIGDGVTFSGDSFGVSFMDPFGHDVSELSGEFAGSGDGTVYECDPSIFSYAASNAILGLSTDGSGAKYLVLPRSHDSRPIENVAASAFASNTSILGVFSVPDGSIKTFQGRVFEGCTSLKTFVIPDSVISTGGYMFNGDTALEKADLSSNMTTMAIHVFRGCTSLASVTLPDGLQSIASFAFGDCTGLQSIEIPRGVTEIASNAFSNCSGLEAVVLPSGVRTLGDHAFDGCSGMEAINIPASITSIGAGCFIGCTGLTAISFASGFAATLGNNWASSWTFYESDAATVITKTAANLAGKTFQGTAAALVEVAPGQLTLTPQQLQQVQLHTQELQQQELDIQPLPFQPTVQTQDQEPVSA